MSGLEHITLLKINSSALNCNYLGLIFAIRLSAKFRKIVDSCDKSTK